MTKAQGWSAYQRRRRAAGAEVAGGLAAGEAAKLRAAAAATIDGLSDALLGFAGEGLLRYFAEHGVLLGLASDLVVPMRGGEGERVAALRAIADALRELPAARGATLLDRQLRWLGDTLALSALDRRVLGVFARVSLLAAWRELAAASPGGGHRLRAGSLAQLLRAAPDTVEARLQPAAPLLATGLIVDEQDGDFRAGRFLSRIAHLNSADPAMLSARMLPPAPASTLEWDDFVHLGPTRDIAERAIAAAAAGNRGLNLLLHGMPGTGKSEFVRAVAGRLGLVAVFAGLTDEAGEEPNRYERLAHLAVLRALTRGSATHLIVVDEADDVLRLPREGDRAQMSKLYLNRLIEDARAPTVWITNDTAALGETAVRRMTLAIGFELPPRAVRARVLERQAARAGVALSAEEVARVAALPIAPAVLANAVDAARLAGGGGETARAAGESVLRALGGGAMPPERLPAAYDPALAHADVDLAALAEQLVRAPGRGWSLLLSGPSGTGKSAYARHLAERLGVEVDERRGSDLLSPFVGGTEANIADAFRRAGETGALLLIDEADSFLFDRASATRSWESGMVNEMLRWMEALRAPFVATTNLHDMLDPATQRRFTLRVAMRTLTPARAAALFERYFGAVLPTGTEPLDGLTPGDFGVVAARAALLGERVPATLLRWLTGEAEARGARRGRAGFHLPAPEPRFRLAEERSGSPPP